MDFIDYRKSPEKITIQSEPEEIKARQVRRKNYQHYIDEQIHEAQARGDFDNLEGMGKPLSLDDVHAGDRTMAYRLLKNNNVLPVELELAKEVRKEQERAEVKVRHLIHQGQSLRRRRIPPFGSEKKAYNRAVEKGLEEYEDALRKLNKKILTLNLMVPSVMQQPFLNVEQLVEGMRENCPLFDADA